jgi:hypothetical protein
MSVVRFQDLPLAYRRRRWDGTAANKRVRKSHLARYYRKLGEKAPWEED